MTAPDHTAYCRLTDRSGHRRLWLAGRHVEAAGFTHGIRYALDYDDSRQTLVIRRDTAGKMVHRRTRGGRWIPVIDVANRLLSRFFGGIETIRVRFYPDRIEVSFPAGERAKAERFSRLFRKLTAGTALNSVSLCHGGGILDHAIHTGFADASVDTTLTAAVEIEGDYIDASLQQNPLHQSGTRTIQADLMDVAVDPALVSHPDGIDILIAGLPCTGASQAGKAARGHEHAEDHPDAGHLFIGFLEIVAAINPAIVILENVPEYADTLGCRTIVDTLRRRSYRVETGIVHGTQHGALETRTRLCMVATTTMSIDLTKLERQKGPTTVGEILDETDDEDPAWSTREALWTRAARNKARGANFQPRVVDESSREVRTLTRGYAYKRGYEPILRHPRKPDHTRLFSVAEHARLKTVPEELVRSIYPRTAHEILGQGVIYNAFRSVGRLIGKQMRDYSGRLTA